MGFLKKLGGRMEARRQPGGKRSRAAIPVGAGLTAIALLLNLGLTQFMILGYLQQDGFAVPQNTLAALLRSSDAAGTVPLVSVEMGEAIYARAIGSRDYFIGEDKRSISNGYPIYIRDGLVLYFLDGSLRMVTGDWGSINGYDGLYLSDGVTFNADNTQADLERILMVQVDGGYILAQEAKVSSALRSTTMPMNAACAFFETEIVFYSYREGVMTGDRIQMAEGATIEIDGVIYAYQDFLERLGLWAEAPEKLVEIPEEQPPLADASTDENDKTARPIVIRPEDASPAKPSDPAQPAPDDRKPVIPPSNPGTNLEPKPPADNPEAPSGPIDSPDSNPATPETPANPPVVNPDYVKPEVSFGELSAWVYTLSTEASIYDPAHVLRNGGVQLYIYQVENDRETPVLRQTVSASGLAILGQVRPSTRFHVVAEFSYRDENNILRSEQLDLGYATTLGFDTLEPIAFSLRDETVQGIGLEPVEIFSRSLQGRDIVFSNISNGISVEVDDQPAASSSAGLKRAEGYVNVLTLHAVAEGSKTATDLRMDSRALRLLCSGYTLSHWETPKQLKSGTQYTYTVTMGDRFGNQFTVVPNQSSYSGHTCKLEPSVIIRVPDATNVTNSTQIDVTWRNPDQAEVQADTRADSVMGSEIVAGLYLVRTGEEGGPPLTLTAYRVNSSGQPVNAAGQVVSEAQATVTGPYLPIAATQNGSDVSTSWVVKDLVPFSSYTAAVKCGSYIIDDGKVHLGEDLETSCQFLTISLRSRVSYTAQVDGISSEDARLRFQMNPTDEVLIPLIDQVNFTLQKRTSGEMVGSFGLFKEDLSKIPIPAASGTAQKVPIYVDGTQCEIDLTLFWETVPSLPDGSAPRNAWEFLLATSTVGEDAGCWLSLQLGGAIEPGKENGSKKLFDLEPVTQYIGRFTTSAKLGGVLVDVTSSNSQSVIFRTLSEEVVVEYDNVFVSDSFIEIYGLKIEDEGGSVLEDVEKRGGNIAVRVYEYHEGAAGNPVGNQVAYLYINQEDYAQAAQNPLRISGLTRDRDYVMIFQAQRYHNGVDTAPEQNRPLRYAEPQDTSHPTWLVFKTGETVSGELDLLGVTQQYWGDGNQLTTTLSILTEDDFYTGVWQDNLYLYYVDSKLDPDGNKIGDEGKSLATYKQELRLKETELTQAYLQQMENIDATYQATMKPLTARFLDRTWSPENIWTSRFIKVEPGEKYVIYGGYATNDLRITFFNDNGGGLLRYYTQYSDGNYARGDVFEVPRPTSGNLSGPYYMRISATNLQVRSGMIVEKYDPSRTAGRPNLGEGAGIVEGLYLNSSNGVSNSMTMAYVADYIGGITGGSVYEIKGRDPNRPDSSAMLGSNTTNDYVCFYDSSYTFLAGYTVGSQTALVKAPFGAAYCRFNVRMRENADGNYTAPDWNSMSIKLYKEAALDRYSVSFRLLLEDRSAAQMMRGGQYAISLFSTDTMVSDAADLEAVENWTPGSSQSWKIDPSEGGDSPLSINRILSFQDLPPNRGIKAVLTVQPAGWSSWITLDTTYFTTNRVVNSISSYEDLLSIRSNPAGSYVVVADLKIESGRVLDSDRPFTGVIDFQGHKLEITNTVPLFRRISAGGVVKNVEVLYNAVGPDSATSALSYQSAITENNYGTIQNVVVRYNPTNPAYQAVELYYSGAICTHNYGVIDGFIVEFQRDVYVNNYFGGICLYNYGEVCNGYVTGVPVYDELRHVERRATVIHRYQYAGMAVGTTAQRVSPGVGFNASRGSIHSVYVVNNIIIESAKGESTPEEVKDSLGAVTKPADSSVTSTTTAALVVGENSGRLENVYAAGDRWDYGVDGMQEIMTDRGPAVGYVNGMYYAENVSYFSDKAYNTSPNRDTIGTYNVRTQPESLYEYQWHEFRLGKDGQRFVIRDMIEKDEGYYPQLILPECFAANNFKQPEIPLADRNARKVEILFNEVRVQGVDQALVTVSIANPSNEPVTGIKVYDDTHPSLPLDCEVLAQGAVGATYQVDILLSLATNGAVTVDSQDSYAIGRVSFASGDREATDRNGERIIHASFWKTIGSVEEYRMEISGNTASNVTGNYLLTADLDFSESASYTDWHRSDGFRGVLNGGIYSLKDVELTDYLGRTLRDEAGQARTIGMWDMLVGMHSISGVGNMDKNGNYMASRRGGDYTNSLFLYFYGTMENLVFQNFRSVNNAGTSEANAYYSGVVAILRAGAVLDNCHVRGSNFFGRNNIGALVGNASGATITNCSVGNTVIETVRRDQSTETISVGGLAGYTVGCTVENCFASGVNITASDVYNTNGIGGLVGYANGGTLQSCYTAGGSIDLSGFPNRTNGLDVGAGRAGGLAGQITGDITMTGCWTATTVMTSSDYAGGLVGYHAAGILANNYTASTLITRSLAASSVHRICNNVNFSESNRHDNYAFAGQYLTYTNPNPKDGESIYQFGVWDELDGATRLLTGTELGSIGTWSNQIGLNAECFDLEGTARSVVDLSAFGGALSSEKGHPFSDGTSSASILSGYMPKLCHSETGFLLYGQENIQIGFESSSVLSRVKIQQNSTSDEFTARLALFSLREDLQGKMGTIQDPNLLFDWSKATVVGGSVKGSLTLIGGAMDDASLPGGRGQVFEFTVQYGDAAGDGHYLDSYVFSVPVYTENPYRGPDGTLDPTTPTEILQVRLSLTGTQGQTEPVYKNISGIEEWNQFFRPDAGHAAYFENVRLTGPLEFTVGADGKTTDEINVKLNRLTGQQVESNRVQITAKQEDGSAAPPIQMSKAGMSLISQVATEISKVDIVNIGVTSTTSRLEDGGTDSWRGGDNKGIIGLLQGDIRDVNFKNVMVEGGNSSSIGLIGRMYGTADGVTLDNISVNARNSYIGGLVGYAESYATLKNVTVTNTAGKRNTVSSEYGEQIGGIVGRLDGLGSDLKVSRTDVKGRRMVGGLAGSTYTDGNRPDENKLQNCVVGEESRTAAIASRDPGVLLNADNSGNLAPDVTVTLTVTRQTNYEVRYGGGAVGYGEGRKLQQLEVYNTQVKVDYSTNMTAAGIAEGTYTHYMGGVVGGGGGWTQNCLADNCTVSTYGMYAGGVGGEGVSYYNTARDCAVFSEHAAGGAVGGVTGAGGAYRCVAQHCVISGANNVGGYTGLASNTSIVEGGVVDCVVLGRQCVGGLLGLDRTLGAYRDYVTTSEVPVPIQLRANMLAPALASHATDAPYSGTNVVGVSSVGGLVGEKQGVSIQNCFVNDGVNVTGTSEVGGLVGCFYGWHRSYWNTSNRSLVNSAMGADVSGQNNVGGAIGYYTQWEDSTADGKKSYTEFPYWTDSQKDKKWNTCETPARESFYGLLITGNVTATDTDTSTTGILLGSGKTAPTGWNKDTLWPTGGDQTWDDVSGKRFFQYCRIYEGSTVSGKSLTTLKSFDKVSALALSNDSNTADLRTEAFQSLLTVTGDNLTDQNLYFRGRDNSYGGMGWSRTDWDLDPLQRMYEPSQDSSNTKTPASFSKYDARDDAGIVKDNLVLWLDGRNNTGEGYTDEASEYWKDLSGSGNDATLFWNNKNSKSEVSQTIAERASVMRWNDGALEFYSGTAAYYAQLKESLSPLLNSYKDGFTVELIYSYVTPRHSNHNSILSWKTATAGGGFHGYYSPNYSISPSYRYNHGQVHFTDQGTRNYGVNFNNKDVANKTEDQFIRSTAYVLRENGDLSYYVNGERYGTRTGSGALAGLFIEGEETWRIGEGAYTNNCLRVCGVRVYGKALEPEDLERNAAYNMWYYFGGEMPSGATAQTGTLTLNADGTVSGGPYKLFRSDSGGYNGTLADENYTGQGLGSRGYYYVMDSAGNYSNIVAKYDQAFGPRLHTTDQGNEYYGVPKYYNVYGQEGERPDGTLYDADDNMFYGGFKLPDYSQCNDRDANKPGTATTLRLTRRNSGLPSAVAYPSGADTVNLELDSDVPEGLEYAVYASADPGEEEQPVLSGQWPEDSRVLTMTWDYQTPFTLRLSLGEEQSDQCWYYTDLGRTVMLYGEDYWYLYGSQCYTGRYSGEQTLVTEDGSVVFLHMMDGQLLDEAGNLWSAQDGAVSGRARTAFQLLDTPVALWSGRVDGLTVNSYGFHLTSSGGEDTNVRELGLVVRDGNPYLLQQMQPNNFLVNGDFCLTVLEHSGTLRDDLQPLVYPESFRNAGIRELADNMDYTGYKPIALVRYGDGTLIAFDYTTGETIDVVSPETSMSLMDFVSQGLNATGLRSLITGTSGGEALRGLAYEKEVAGNVSLRTQLANLTSNALNSTIVDGQGSGVYGEDVAGGQDGEVRNPGMDSDNGGENVINPGQSVVEGEGFTVEGEAIQGGPYTGQDGEIVVAGEGNPNGRPDGAAGSADGQVPDGTSEAVSGELEPSEQPVEPGEPEPGEQPVEPGEPEPGEQPGEPGEPEPGEQPVEPGELEPGEQPGEPGELEPGEQPGELSEPESGEQLGEAGEPEPGEQPVEPGEPEPGEMAEPGQEDLESDPAAAEADGAVQPELGDFSGINRYVTVYDPEGGSSAVYDLREFLSQPEEELVSQEERAEELARLGYHTALSGSGQAPKETASGLALMYLVTGGTVVMLVCMTLLKRRKLDDKE